MSHGPKFSSHYWASEFDESATNEQAMHMTGLVWYFTVEAVKPVLESGTYTCAWRFKIEQQSQLSHLDLYTAQQPIAEGVIPQFVVTREQQETFRGRGWFYMVIRGVQLEAGKRVHVLVRETHEAHRHYWVDCAVVLPTVLLEGVFPVDKTIFLN